VEVLQSAKSALSIDEIAEKAGAAQEIEAIYKILRHLHANQRGVVLHGNLAQPSSLKVSVG